MPASSAAYRQRSRIALGVCVIALMFLSETVVVHMKVPNPASPVVWALLGTIAVAAAAYAIWCHRKWRAGC